MNPGSRGCSLMSGELFGISNDSGGGARVIGVCSGGIAEQRAGGEQARVDAAALLPLFLAHTHSHIY